MAIELSFKIRHFFNTWQIYELQSRIVIEPMDLYVSPLQDDTGICPITSITETGCHRTFFMTSNTEHWFVSFHRHLSNVSTHQSFFRESLEVRQSGSIFSIYQFF